MKILKHLAVSFFVSNTAMMLCIWFVSNEITLWGDWSDVDRFGYLLMTLAMTSVGTGLLSLED